MRVRALPLFAMALLAGCGAGDEPGNDAATAGMNEIMRAQAEGRAPDRDTVYRERWASVFASPDAVIAAARDMGYDVGAYAEGRESFTTGYGTEQEYGEEDGKVAVATNFRALGTQADAVERITFTFTITGEPTTKGDRDTLRIPGRIVRGFLQRFEVGPDPKIQTALRDFTSASATEFGATVTVDAVPIETTAAGETRLVVTMYRANGATA
jgi:hypothetical protein